MSRAADVWNDLLTPDLASESAEWLLSQLSGRALMFGDRPLCNVLRPRLLSTHSYEMLRATIRRLMGAFDKALEAAIARPDVLAQFRPEDWEVSLALEDPGFPASPFSRMDAFFGQDDLELNFTEYNAETPAGSGYNDALTELFLAIPAMREFRSRYQVRPLPVRHQVMHSLLDAYASVRGTGTRPAIGIIDWRDVPTQSEFRLFQEYFRSLGFSCVIADPRDCDYRDGRFYAGGSPIDLIYKRVLISELIEHGGLTHPMVRAVRDRAVVMVNPFRCKLLHKKASLAVLSDERNADLFSAQELEVIDNHVPWTRMVEERTTRCEGQSIDLVPFAAANRERLVLKPNDDYGGTGVVLGWEVDDATWERSLQTALERPFIVQQRIPLPTATFPSLVDGTVVFADRIVDTAPFVFGGAFVDGCLTRISTATLVNVTAGGGSTIPTFIAEPR